MSGLKERLYEKIVRKNERVRRAYERYVIGHLAEHRSHRLKHWLVLASSGLEIPSQPEGTAPSHPASWH